MRLTFAIYHDSFYYYYNCYDIDGRIIGWKKGSW